MLVGMKISASLVDNSMEVYKKTKNGTMVWPSNPTPGYISLQKKQ